MEQQDKKISQMTQLTNISGDESVPVVRSGGNYRVLVNQIVALARQTMVAAETGKGLSANDFTDALKAKLEGLSNYDDAEVRSLITAINGRLDTILGDGASSAIDTFNEIEAFLAGITDTQTLTGLLQQQKQTITSETDAKLSGKVDKVAGKGLSANDYTDDEKAKLSALPTKAELDSSLGAKLDKSKWDEEHGQFTIKGYFLSKTGKVREAAHDVSAVTPLLPLSKTYPIVLKNVLAINSAVAVCFYGATGSFISYPEGIENLNGDFTVSADKYPENACFFRVCTEKAGSTYTNGPTLEAREGAVSEAIQASKLALFVDEFNAAAGSNGKYDPKNAPDAEHPFYINTIWLTYEEAVKSLEAFTTWGTSSMDFYCSGIRTNIPPLESSARTYSNSFKGIEVVNLAGILALNLSACLNGNNLKKVLNFNANYLGKVNNSFNAPALTDLQISNLKISLDLSKCPLINLASWQGLVANAANTSEITVTVHPDVYAKLTDATNAEWYAVAEAAAAKNIAFATTN